MSRSIPHCIGGAHIAPHYFGVEFMVATSVFLHSIGKQGWFYIAVVMNKCVARTGH